MKKYLILAFGLFILFPSHAQTKMIGHKSHSGANATFDITTEGNFGEFTDPSVIKIQKLSDSVVVFTYDKKYRLAKATDTLTYHHKVTRQDFELIYYKAKFVGFKKQKIDKNGGAMIDIEHVGNKSSNYLAYLLVLFTALIGYFTWYTNGKH